MSFRTQPRLALNVNLASQSRLIVPNAGLSFECPRRKPGGLGAFLFHTKPQFLFKSIMPAGCWATKITMPSIAHEQSVPLLLPTPDQLFIDVELTLSGTIAGVLGKKYDLTLEVSCVALPM